MRYVTLLEWWIQTWKFWYKPYQCVQTASVSLVMKKKSKKLFSKEILDISCKTWWRHFSQWCWSSFDWLYFSVYQWSQTHSQVKAYLGGKTHKGTYQSWIGSRALAFYVAFPYTFGHVSVMFGMYRLHPLGASFYSWMTHRPILLT